MVFWICISLLGIFTAVSEVMYSKKLSGSQKKRSVMGIWGIAATLTVLLLIVDTAISYS
ncbi:hypothetical protein IMZ31_11970 [Pontibacillus sp. ALD_SL1]|uniref:hypothetical protein n=1 Tax=Pontibacillus sp. ALD_SL1 TaxID=2777185 RepID=UPI001A96F34E|nr:hypothetical protein [Pontibacillus sp. ALD_SL1]QSS98820.1 hypothetical protein IMZ31_11970 [Pontibacillus sp. ALD_SL1]